ncbi:hypothetical protein CCH79_00004948 [Gambusia affinis]|uniref:Platelet-derived growth factor (PDGF) family profile domain-containing protein n=1 Tax=Gambusia affinis TaxID=33528 RepID=A0A315V862_GAMAF|nr:hypothetical protein CCH79_00004948 [Gambusia affinis]
MGVVRERDRPKIERALQPCHFGRATAAHRLWKCRLKLQPPQVQTEASSFPPSLIQHLERQQTLRAFTALLTENKESAVNDEEDAMQSVLDLFLAVGARCGGCCNDEGLTCRNMSTVYVNKTIFSFTPFKLVPEPVLIKVANHTACSCMEPAIIRRNAQQRRRSGSWLSDCEIDVERCECLPRPQPIERGRERGEDMRQVSSGPGIELATAASRAGGLRAWGALPSTPPEHAP